VVYNPREPTDRLLLGVKGRCRKLNCSLLRTPLYEGRRNKAREGQLQFALPVGYAGGADGNWELDLDAQVRERLGYVFESFSRHGVARSVVPDLKQDGFGSRTPRSSRKITWKN